MKMEKAELKYWYNVVKNYMDRQEDWRYLDDATQGLLDGTHNQHYIDDEIEYAVLRYRQLRDELDGHVSAT